MCHGYRMRNYLFIHIDLCIGSFIHEHITLNSSISGGDTIPFIFLYSKGALLIVKLATFIFNESISMKIKNFICIIKWCSA